MRLAMSLNERWFTHVQGSTDSEWAFALFLDCLDRAGHDPDTDRGFGPSVLRKGILKTIERINALIKETVGEEAVGEEDSRSLLNFAVTDGDSVVCSRYVSSRTDEAASLFWSSGTSWKESNPKPRETAEPGQIDYVMERRDKGSDIVLVASEPLTFERGKLNLLLLCILTLPPFHRLCPAKALADMGKDNWVTVPTNSTVTIHKQTVMIHPIIDDFYSPNPAHARSAGFAQAKGQTITGPDKVVLQQPVNGAGSGGRSPDHSKEVVRGAISRLTVR